MPARSMRLMDAETVVTKLKASWRGRKQRKLYRRQHICATIIQAAFRGGLYRMRNYGKSDRMKILRNLELERLERMRTIRAKERELTLLKRIPIEDFLNIERMRRVNSARVLQRYWRRATRKAFTVDRKTSSSDHQTNSVLSTRNYGSDYQKMKSDSSMPSKGRNDGRNDKKNDDGGMVGLSEHAKSLIKIVSGAIKNYSLNKPGDHSIKSTEFKELRADISRKVEVDSLGLARVHRLIRDEAAQKRREQRSRQNRGHSASSIIAPAGDAAAGFTAIMGTRREGGVGREGPEIGLGIASGRAAAKGSATGRSGGAHKYQDILEYQQRAAALIQEHLASAEALKDRQRERLFTLGHCTHMLSQLQNLPSLDQAATMIRASSSSVSSETATPTAGAEMKKDVASTWRSWLKDLPVDADICGVIAAHDETVSIMTASKQERKWSVVAAPHDVSGPPIDIKAYADARDKERVEQSKTLFANTWASGYDIEESLWWVAYASQQNAKATTLDSTPLDEDAEAGDVTDSASENRGGWTVMGKPGESEGQKRAHAMLGEVEGEKLLRQLSKEMMTAEMRLQNVILKYRLENEKTNRLAHVFTEEALGLLRQRLAEKARSQFTAEDISRREKSATTIQALCRGKRARKFASMLRSEKRVMHALQSLVYELSRPELRTSGLPIAQMDSAIMQRVAAVQLAYHASAAAGVDGNRSAVSRQPNRIDDSTKAIQKVTARPGALLPALSTSSAVSDLSTVAMTPRHISNAHLSENSREQSSGKDSVVGLRILDRNDSRENAEFIAVMNAGGQLHTPSSSSSDPRAAVAVSGPTTGSALATARIRQSLFDSEARNPITTGLGKRGGDAGGSTEGINRPASGLEAASSSGPISPSSAPSSARDMYRRRYKLAVDSPKGVPQRLPSTPEGRAVEGPHAVVTRQSRQSDDNSLTELSGDDFDGATYISSPSQSGTGVDFTGGAYSKK